MTIQANQGFGVSVFGATSAGGGGSTSPGGSSGQVQYNNGGSFGGMSGTTWTDASQSLAIASTGAGTGVTTSSPVLNLSQTWNAAGVTFTGLKFNATDTASASGSLLLDLQVGGTGKVQATKAGTINAVGGVNVGSLNDNATFANIGGYATITNLNGGNGVGFTTYGGNAGSAYMLLTGSTVALRSTSILSWSATGDPSAGKDFFLSRGGTATLQLGAADTTGTTAPTPQFLRVQSWSSSTNNNQLGADFTIQGSRGTGTGAGGSIIFQVAPAGGSSNGVQNAYSTALTIDSSKNATFTGNGSFIGAITLTPASNSMRLTGFSGSAYIDSGDSIFHLRNYTTFTECALAIDAANTLALRNGTNAQLFRVYSTYNGTNDAYGAIGAGVKLDGTYASGDENILYIGSQKKGSPTALTKLAIQVNGTTYLDYNITVGNEWVTSSKIRASSFQTTSGDFLCASAAYIYWGSRAQMKSPADKVLVVEDSNANATIIQTKQFTVTNLPAPTSYAGAMAFVSDATATTPRSTVLGGGSNKVMVMSDGTNWLIVA